MDWLKSAAQAAFAKGNAIPGLTNFGLGDRQSEYNGLTLWTLYSGTKRDDASPVSVFVFDAAQPTSLRTDRKTLLQLARNALRKLKTLRHPDLIRYIDGSETDSAVYIVTEPVVPLSTRIGRDGEIKPTSASALDQGTGEEWRIWGLSKMVNALAFINDSVGATHGNLRLSSVFVAPGGDWRLGGFELLSSEKDPSPTLYTLAGLVPQASMFAPPEARMAGYTALKDNDAHAYDSFLLYLFMHLLFNGPLPPSTTSETPTSRGNIPPSLFPHARRLYTPNGPPNSRMKASTLWAAATAQTPPGPFRANRLVRLADGLDGFALANEADKAALIRNIKECLPGENAKPASKLPAEFLKYKVLPSLVKSFELPQAGPQLLPLIIALSAEFKAEEYQKLVLPAIIKGFASPDRAMRMALLEGLPNYIEKLDKRVVVDKIWPSLLTGFSDVVPVIREATVKATLQFAPKLTDRILNNDLLRLLAKTQTDTEPGIRTNTCILLGRLAPHLSQSTSSKVLVPAFARAMRDPFQHARIAGLMAVMATAEGFSKEDLAGRILPSMGVTLVDGEKVVRDQAFQAVKMIMARLEQEAKKMPDTLLQPGQDQPMNSGTATTNGTVAPSPVSSTGGAASALGSWAMSSFVKKLGASDLQSGITGQTPASQSHVGELPSRPASVPVEAPNLTASASTSSLASQGQGNWGTSGDLMDVSAGADDWDPFEEEAVADAPLPIEEISPLPPDISRLSTTALSKKPAKSLSSSAKNKTGAAARPNGKMKLGSSGSSKPNKALEAIESELPPSSSSWDMDAEMDDFDEPVAPIASAKAARKPASNFSASNSVSNSKAGADGWNDKDESWGSTQPAAATSKTASTAAASASGKSKVAQMREERKARVAAMKAASSGPTSPVSTPPPSTSRSFRSGAQTEYRF